MIFQEILSFIIENMRDFYIPWTQMHKATIQMDHKTSMHEIDASMLFKFLF